MVRPEAIIHDRALTLCDATKDWSVPELIRECPGCKDFLLYCCACNTKFLHVPRHRQPGVPCHHFRVIFTDGACTNNGLPNARAGVGVAYGNDDDSQLSEPITDIVDAFPARSNQRAELCAAKAGIEFLAKAHTEKQKSGTEAWIVATDSEYVVKGMTEWLPTWKENDWRTSKGTTPANLDLFLALDSVVATQEAKNVTIGFWHIPRKHNKLADRLAKAAAANGDEAGI